MKTIIFLVVLTVILIAFDIHYFFFTYDFRLKVMLLMFTVGIFLLWAVYIVDNLFVENL